MTEDKSDKLTVKVDDYTRRQYVIPIDEGECQLLLPSELSRESVSEIEQWLLGICNRIRHKAGLDKLEF